MEDSSGLQIYDRSRTETLKQSFKLDHLSLQEKGSVESVCIKYSDIFYLDGDSLPYTNLMQHEVHLKDDTPIHVRNYRLPESLKNEVERQITKMLKEDILRITSLLLIPLSF